ncbi:MAG: DsrE/DsrF/TusD sulfur relay family protein [Steroidobacteraceae bacterium]
MKTALTFALMDAPYENSRTVTLFRLIEAALEAGHDVNVFAYEGAVALSFARQAAHANAVHGRDAAAENHPLPRAWIEELLRLAARKGRKLEWVNCGLCVDERGVGEAIEGVRRGSPADFWKMSVESGNTLTVGTR